MPTSQELLFDLKTTKGRHKALDLAGRRNNQKAQSVEFFKTFPDNHLINHPYKVEIAQGEWTCTVADFTGTMRGPMKGSDSNLIAPTNKKFHVEFCTVAHGRTVRSSKRNSSMTWWGCLKQIGVM